MSAATAELLGSWTPQEGAARARELFTETFGSAPAGVWAAPGRVNVIGEHTDYNGGLAFPIALPHRTYVAAAPRADRVLRLISTAEAGVREVDLDAVGPAGSERQVPGWPSYVAGVAWALEGAGGLSAGAARRLPGMDVAVVSCVPTGAGLSSSAALSCSAAVAWDELAGLGLAGGEDSDAGRARLVDACVQAENDVAGAPTGGMDQAASLRAREGHALLLDCRDGAVEHVPFDLGAAGLELLVIDTRATHSHVDGGYRRRRDTCEEAAALLGVPDLREVTDEVAAGRTSLAGVLARLANEEQRKRVRHVVTEITRVRELAAVLRAHPGRALTGAALDEAGRLLDASHESMRDDYEISCPELDLAVSTAQAAGAHGARMTGGGFGGSAIALVDAERADETAAAVAAAFAEAGFTAPAVLHATAAAPAERVG